MRRFPEVTAIQNLRNLFSAVFLAPEVVRRFSAVEGWLDAQEGYALFLMAAYGPGNGAIVEIGSYMGRSTCFLALGAQVGGRERVVAIDPFTGSEEHQEGGTFQSAAIVMEGTTFTRFKQNLTQADLWGQVEPIAAYSADAGRDWSRPIRLLFIDGDHSYEGVRLDFELFQPHLTAEALVCFHDLDHPSFPGVTQFYQECIADGWRQELRIGSLGCLSRV